MAERKAVNKYYPPDWDPSKQGSVNKRVGQHPLRDRARKLSQGILIIRFELPYNIWCDGCNNMVGMGVRYNAEKKKVGNYYSTPIYKFRMKCHLCDSHFEIITDPKNHDYVVVSGARRKEQRWDPHQNEQIVLEDKATQKKLATDAMYKLEHGSDDQNKSKLARPGLGQIETRRGQWKDDYLLNKLARNKFRAEKKSIKAKEDKDKSLLEKSSLDIALVDENQDDVHLASLLKYRTIESFDERQKQKRREIEERPLFVTSGSSLTVTSPCQSNSKSLTNNKLVEHKKQLGLFIGTKGRRPFSDALRKSPTQSEVQSPRLSVSTQPHDNLLSVNTGNIQEKSSACVALPASNHSKDTKLTDSGLSSRQELPNALHSLQSHYGESESDESSQD